MRQPKSTQRLGTLREVAWAGKTSQRKEEDDEVLEEKLKERGRGKNVSQTLLLISLDVKRPFLQRNKEYQK